MSNSSTERKAAAARKRGREIVGAIEGSFGSIGRDGQARLGGVVASKPPRYTRDNQRSLVYTAENHLRRVLEGQYLQPLVQVCGSTVAVPLERMFGDLGQVQQYCTDALNRCWPAYSQAVRSGVTVRLRKGETQATYKHGVIAVPVTHDRWAMRQLVALHELAHHLVPDANHDALFIRAYLHLLEQEMGPEMAMIARCTFGEFGVKM